MYPDLFNAKVRGERAWDAVGDEAWVADEFIPRVGKRGAEIIEARGASSAASAANAAIDHVHDWVHGTPDGDWVSMAVPSDGAYGVEEGIISSFPCRCSGGEWEIVAGPRRARLLPGADRQDGRPSSRRSATRCAKLGLRRRASRRRRGRASRGPTSSPCPLRRGRASRGTGSSA